MKFLRPSGLWCVVVLALAGCQSPYRSDQGALIGGLGGAGLGAIVGNQVGHTGAGAAIGGVTGLLAGSVVGDQLDQIEARNRAEIQARIGRVPGPGAVSVEDVIEMSQKRVDEQVLVDHVRARGVSRPLGKDDLIMLSQAGVSPRVVKAMQEPPLRPAAPVAYAYPPPPGPVIVEEHYYGPPVYCGPGPRWHGPHHHRPGYSVGLSYSN